MDRITQSLLNGFIKQNGLEHLPEETAFEIFTCFLIVSSHYTDTFENDDLAVGAGADCGIDSIAVIVNGSLVTEPEEINDLAETNGYLDVIYIFIQSERSSSFDTAKIGQFSFGVGDFFADAPKLPRNAKISHYGLITKEIYSRSRYFKRGNPQCFLYYATTGKWTDDANLVTRRNSAIRDLEGTGLFRKVSFECVDANNIQRLFREAQNVRSIEIVFSERTVVPEIPRIEQAFVGLISATEFLKIIENENNEVIASLFYDNVRQWQEWNQVNNQIRDTLNNQQTNVYFPLLNNGITIVAKRINTTGNRLLMEDYQIVNGCQTSYVLHECRDQLNDRIMIPVRIIATRDEEIKNSIIRATNKQTQVTDEQFFALFEFPKKIELYFPSFERHKLFYERQSRQYNNVEGIEKIRIISMTILVRAFASIFLCLPHRTTRNYRMLLNEIGKDIFNRDHRLEPYYVAAYSHFRMESLFRKQLIAPELKPARYHILLATRIIAFGKDVPRLNSHDMEKYCKKYCDLLWNEEDCNKLFIHSSETVRRIAHGNLHRDHIRTEAFTTELLQNF